MPKIKTITPRCKLRSLQPAQENSTLLALLKDEFSEENAFSEHRQQLVMVVPSKDYERLGNLINKLQGFIESRMPHRKHHLYIAIRDQAGTREQVFKFWKGTDL